MRALTLALLLAVLSACQSMLPPSQVVCPHMEFYTKAEQAQRANEFKARKAWQDYDIQAGQRTALKQIFSEEIVKALEALRKGRSENRFLRDYGALRARLKAVNCKPT